jgi:hypothetical protein
MVVFMLVMGGSSLSINVFSGFIVLPSLCFFVFVFSGDERLVCCVTGPRRFPPPNHAKSFWNNFREVRMRPLGGKGVEDYDTER